MEFKDHNDVVAWMEKNAPDGAVMHVWLDGVEYIYEKDAFGVHHVANAGTYHGPE